MAQEDRPTTLERAFELAGGGECATVGDIKDTLRQEGYSHNDVTGPSLLRQLRELCVAAQTGRSEQKANSQGVSKGAFGLGRADPRL